MHRLFLIVLAACMTGEPTPFDPPAPEADTDTDADADADTDADTDSDADTDPVVPTGQDCLEDALEPNDTLPDASPLADHDDLWVRRDEPDLFVVTVPAGSRLQATASHQWETGDIDIYIVDGNTSNLGTSGSTVGDVERAIWCNDTGTDAVVYVYVEIWSEALDACNTYDLAHTITPDSCTADTDLP